MTPNPAYTQKLLKAGKEVIDPLKKAKASVKDVIVIEAPAFDIPIFILFTIESFGSVVSRALTITKISSTPIPISKKVNN